MVRAPFEIRTKWAGYKGQWILLALCGSRLVVLCWQLRQLKFNRYTQGGHRDTDATGVQA